LNLSLSQNNQMMIRGEPLAEQALVMTLVRQETVMMMVVVEKEHSRIA